jgi:hypothetical protein
VSHSKLNWVLDSQHAEQPELFADDREIIWFDILDFLKHTHEPWTLDPNNLKRRNERKVEDAKNHFEGGGWMDPSDIQGLCCDRLKNAEPDDKRIMLEGRHRLIAAMQLGETYAPFSVPLDMVDQLKSTIDVCST